MSLKRNHEGDICNASKRKHVALTVMQKVEILKKMESGSTPRFIAENYGIAVRTVYDIRKQKEKILNFYSNSDTNAGIQKRKSLHEAKSNDLDAVLYEWFKQRRSDGVPISGPILKEKGRQIHSELKIAEPCDFSTGWLNRFKQRHGIRYLKACGEKLSADTESAEQFVEEFSSFVAGDSGLSPEQIFNMDETGLFWRCLPRNTFVTSEESAPSGIKEAKERLTILLCSNAAGTYKCKPMVVGKSARPRALKDVKVLPVLYKSNKKAWITKDLMNDWFMNHFAKEARRHCNSVGLPSDSKILLLLDNCTAHADATVLSADNITVQFFPPNTTSVIQPMDQGIIHSLKCHYKAEYLKKVLNADQSVKLCDFKKTFTIKDCLYLLKESWDSISKATLVNSWHNLWPSSLFIATENDNYEFSGCKINAAKAKARELLLYAKERSKGKPLFQENDVEVWIANEDEPVEFQMTDEEIIESVLQQTEEDSDSESDILPNEKIPFDEGMELGEKYLKFLEQQNCVTEQEVMTIFMLQKKLKVEQLKVLKQTTIPKMFEKFNK